MSKSNFWTSDVRQTTSTIKRLLSQQSIIERTRMFGIFQKLLKPNKNTKILDVGATSLTIYPDSNQFEKLYPFPDKLTAATIESKTILQKLFPKISVMKIKPHRKLPFKDKQFDITVSWATLEHVGSYKQQEDFLNELLRIGKRIFVTTPYRACIFEPHSGLFFLHWLPLKSFRKICLKFGKKDWAREEILNPLYRHDILGMNLSRQVKVSVYKMFGFLPSHLIITSR